MDGATMLGEVKKRDPEVVTVLLTGHTDFESAMSAVNSGSVFRMLAKPCPPEELINALRASVEQNDLIRSKRILLDKTLRGAVDALAHSLSIAKPLFFGRAQRVRRLSNELAELMDVPNSWRVDVASVFSQIAYITLPRSVSDDVYYKKKLSSDVKELVKQLPQDTQKVIEKIPGLEEVDEILQKVDIQYRFDQNDDKGVRLLASVLRVALDFDYYEELGHERHVIVKTLREHSKDYDPIVTEALAKLVDMSEQKFHFKEVSFDQLLVGMRLAEDLKIDGGFLLASSGADVDRQLLKVIMNYNSCYEKSPFPEKIQVKVPKD
jgi:response regulator RpfG family c-di-GMP phosphodiesterase